ncbi:hypothetical protein [Clostridium celatum]|nr:hypothetical protein [Clostridium celatum]MCE9654164.1 hypothetical protein [Clostridium celatum]
MRRLFSILRIASFVALIIFLICKYVFSIELSIGLAISYPSILFLSWLYYKVLHKKYPNYKSTLIEYILMDDVSMFNMDTRRSMRLWNIWHFRNDKSSTRSFGEKVKVWILTSVILCILIGVVIAFI